MRRIPAGIFLGVLFSFGTAAAHETPERLTLARCYQSALKQSETVAIHQERITEAEAHFSQAASGILPRVSFSSSDKRQGGNGGSAFTLKDVPERRFVMSQPLFSGFKEFAAMAGTRAEKRGRLYQKARAEQLLFLDVADAFYLLEEEREDLRALGTIHDLILQRVAELKERERLGRSRGSEVIAAEAQKHRLEAEFALVQGRERLAAQLLSFLTGLEEIGGIVDTVPLFSLKEKNSYVKEAMVRPDVQAASEDLEKALSEIRVAKAKFFPTVNLEGNYYVERVGVAKDVAWDAALKVDVPIFQGGLAGAGVREASSLAEQAKLRFSQIKRTAAREAQDAYWDYAAALLRNEALTETLAATEQSFRFSVEEYRLNLVGNLDVLQSLQLLSDAKRELLHATYEAKRLYCNLRVASGEIAEGAA